MKLLKETFPKDKFNQKNYYKIYNFKINLYF